MLKDKIRYFKLMANNWATKYYLNIQKGICNSILKSILKYILKIKWPKIP